MTAPACGSCGAPVADARLCTSCTRDLALALLTAANIAADLDDAVARLLKRGSGGRSSSPEPPLPVDLAASAAADALRLELAVWTAAVATPSDVMLFSSMTGIRPLATLLARRLASLRQHPAAGRAHRDITAAVHRALAVIDRQPDRAPAGLCPLCRVELFAEVGADTATCPACGYAVTGLRARLRARAAAADVLGTAGEISAMLERIGIRVPRGTITSWASRGRLGTRGKAGLYALSDVLALQAQATTRRTRA
ncbi:MAG TPA: hypothetical protein VHX15_15810 [Frankiaceae bacterium]|nr:hypothetical protein [Frankiaceae bacterium]